MGLIEPVDTFGDHAPKGLRDEYNVLVRHLG
jgi:hypothetical protein